LEGSVYIVSFGSNLEGSVYIVSFGEKFSLCSLSLRIDPDQIAIANEYVIRLEGL